MSLTTAVPAAPLAWLHRHWLGIVNLLVAVFVTLPIAAPVLLAVGLADLSTAIYDAYGLVCHQWAHRSFFLFGPHLTYSHAELTLLVPAPVEILLGSPSLGYKIAFCERDLAIYAAILLGGLVFARMRSSIGPLPVRWYILLVLPIALDGFSQLLGWRESTASLRVLTGAAFGIASVWFLYPRMDIILTAGNRRAAAAFPLAH